MGFQTRFPQMRNLGPKAHTLWFYVSIRINQPLQAGGSSSIPGKDERNVYRNIQYESCIYIVYVTTLISFFLP
jgi:hypothetical protein